MRAYFFGNMYLSSIQQGIQAAHCTAEMYMRYHSGTGKIQNCRAGLYNWAAHYKTMVLLNGGDTNSLYDIWEHCDSGDNPYAWAYFEEAGVRKALTCVGIILPERIYSDDTRYYVRSENRKDRMARIEYKFKTPELTDWEWMMVEFLSGCGLAR